MYSQVTYTGNGTNTVFALPFNYLQQSDILVFVGGVQNNTFTFTDSSHIQISPAPANGATVSISRSTAITFPDVNFADGSTLRAGDLNTNTQQVLYGLQEVNDLVGLSRVQAGTLPVVTSANSNSILQVESGVWSTQTLASFVPTLPVDNSISVSLGLLKVALADTSLHTAAGGVSVQLLANGGLSTVAGGVQVLGRDTSLTIGGLGVGVNVVANGGLNINAGLYVRGVQVLAGDPTPLDGDTWFNSTSGIYKSRLKGATLGDGGLLGINGPGAAVANTLTLTAGSTFSLPANFLVVGRVLRVKATVAYSNTGTPNLQVGLYANGTSNPLSTNFADPIGSGTTGVIEVEWFVHITAVGTSGTANCLTRNCISIGGGADTVFSSVSTGLTVNTTILNTLTIALQWSVASASNTATVQISSVEVLQ